MPPRTAWMENPWMLAALATLAVSTWLAGHVRASYGGNWTALFCHGDKFPVPEELRQGTYVFAKSSGYDGQFYRMIAHDPLFLRGTETYIDSPVMRGRRILLPGLAFLLGGGQRAGIDAAYIALNLGAVFAGILCSGGWLRSTGRHPMWSLGFLALPAVLCGLEWMAMDLFFTGLFAAYLWTARSGRLGPLAAWACALALARELGIFCVAGPMLWLAARREWRKAMWFGVSGFPALAWYGYLQWRVAGAGPGGAQFGRPVVGLFVHIGTLWQSWQGIQLAHFMEWAAYACYVGSLVAGSFWLVRRRKEWGVEMPALALLTALFWLMAEPGYLIDQFGYGRVASPLLLALFLHAVAEGAWARAAMALGVGAGTLTFLKVSLVRILAAS